MSVMAPPGGMSSPTGSLTPAYVKPKSGTVSCNEFAWGELKHMLDNGGVVEQASIGVATEHSKEARTEAARTIIGNHLNLLKDVCNPSPSNNIDSIPLTQLELTRVDAQMAPHIDEALCEVTRRLIGCGIPNCLHSSPAACDARGTMASELERARENEAHPSPEQRREDGKSKARTQMPDRNAHHFLPEGCERGAGRSSAVTKAPRMRAGS